MSDEQAIRNLLFEYAARIDAGDLAGMAALFAEATYGSGSGPVLCGAEAIERVNRELVVLHEDGTPRTAHLVTNVRLDVDAEAGRAEARSRFTVLQHPPGGAIQVIALGRYEDTFARDGDRWRFASRRIHLERTGDLSHHLRRGAPPG